MRKSTYLDMFCILKAALLLSMKIQSPRWLLEDFRLRQYQSFRCLERKKVEMRNTLLCFVSCPGISKKSFLYWNSIALWFSCTAWQTVLKGCASLCIYTTQSSLTVSSSLSIVQATFLHNSEFLFLTNASKFTDRRNQTLIIRIAHPLESADRERQRKPNAFVEQSKLVNWCFTTSQPVGVISGRI